ncbi:hypothetical protein EJ02DRAFT_271487 [Clathrospora elynae]|uniref:Uncharacterized protein n=1 Tax=Clathrospora elynae TaxID=706981 RepID=A0A6A5SHF1_9PLEO|nr:hypothetical protein EJ02DRAFT_271487 [Clathrospora elynae]
MNGTRPIRRRHLHDMNPPGLCVSVAAIKRCLSKFSTVLLSLMHLQHFFHAQMRGNGTSLTTLTYSPLFDEDRNDTGLSRCAGGRAGALAPSRACNIVSKLVLSLRNSAGRGFVHLNYSRRCSLWTLPGIERCALLLYGISKRHRPVTCLNTILDRRQSKPAVNWDLGS